MFYFMTCRIILYNFSLVHHFTQLLSFVLPSPFAETPTKNSGGLNRMSPALTGSSESVSSNPGGSTGPQVQQQSQVSCDRQFVTIVSEKQARVVALPSQTCVYKYQISDADFVVKSEVISMKGKWAEGMFKYPFVVFNFVNSNGHNNWKYKYWIQFYQ